MFIDELGELPLSLQPKLLRVLEDGSMRRIGSHKEQRVNVRIIAATNRKLADDVKDGKFREDLYYRVNVLPILLPPLTERPGDVDLLIDHFLPADWQIASVAQELANSEQSAVEFAIDGDTELRELQHSLGKLEMEDGDGVAIAHLHSQIESVDGYAARSRACRLLHGLGFSTEDLDRPVNTFSGGWRMRLNLAQALMCRSDLLLLDEPTNHLDLDAVIWLENWLRRYEGTLLLISHDRDFLDSVAGHILHIEQQGVKLYTGNYTAFERVRSERLANQQAEYRKQQREVAG